MIRVLLAAALLVFATASAEESADAEALRAEVLRDIEEAVEEEPKFDEIWNCYAIDDLDKEKVLASLSWVSLEDEDGELKIGFVRVAGTGHLGSYSVEGFNRRWDFGTSDDVEGFAYAFVIKPDGTGSYYDFTMAVNGTAAPSQVYECVQD